MDQMIGRMLDNRYELLELIGSGGMAMVYKAKCHRLNRLVAVKVLKSDFASDADFRRRFYDESQAIAMLSHPNIVSVYDVSRSSPEYIVMELIDGITLKQYMERDVYKRQCGSCSARAARCSRRCRISDLSSWTRSRSRPTARRTRRATIPVSYTHLDVYKRQELRRRHPPPAGRAGRAGQDRSEVGP